jgi:hypothetical protein
MQVVQEIPWHSVGEKNQSSAQLWMSQALPKETTQLAPVTSIPANQGKIRCPKEK